jgi:hypothetical protein
LTATGNTPTLPITVADSTTAGNTPTSPITIADFSEVSYQQKGEELVLELLQGNQEAYE